MLCMIIAHKDNIISLLILSIFILNPVVVAKLVVKKIISLKLLLISSSKSGIEPKKIINTQEIKLK